MHFTNLLIVAFLALTAYACEGNGCIYPGNFIGTLSFYADAAASYCPINNPDPQEFYFASIPSHFFASRNISICKSDAGLEASILITNPINNNRISASVIGDCTVCAADNIQLTTAGLDGLGDASGAPEIVEWTFEASV